MEKEKVMHHDSQPEADYPYTAEYPKKRKRWPWVVGIGVLAVLVFCGVGAVMAGSGDGPGKTVGKSGAEAAVSAAAAPQESAASKAPAKAVPQKLGAGDYEVAVKANLAANVITPGLYVGSSDGHCYWERLKNFDGGFDSIITNGNVEQGQTVRVNVKKTDKGLRLQGDCVFARAK
jgi:hypothetical protein